MHHRSWFPVILAGATLALFMSVMFVSKPKAGGFSLPDVLPARSNVAVTKEGYEAAVKKVLADYKETADGKTAYETLILLKVPSAYQAVHLDLVIAFSRMLTGDAREGEVRLNALISQTPWLSL